MVIALMVVFALVLTALGVAQLRRARAPAQPAPPAELEQRETPDPVEAATDEVTAAAMDFSLVPAARYEGTFVSGLGEPMAVDVSVTNRGTLTGTMTLGGGLLEMELLVADGETYVRAGEEFLQGIGGLIDQLPEGLAAEQEAMAAEAERWLKLPPDTLGLADFSQAFAPVLVAEQLTEAASAGQLTLGEETSIDGVQVREVATRDVTAYVTMAGPHEIVRITSPEAATGGSEPTPGPAPGPSIPPPPSLPPPPSIPPLPTLDLEGSGAPDLEVAPVSFSSSSAATQAAGQAPGKFDFNLFRLSDSEVADFRRQLEEKVRGLTSAIDTQVQLTLDGEVQLAPCGNSGCTATATIRNQVVTGTPDLQVTQPVNAEITISITLDGRPVGNCAETKTMPPNGTTTSQCSATYTIPPSRTPRTYQVYAEVQTVARAVVQADIRRILDDLNEEFEQVRADRPGQSDRNVNARTASVAAVQQHRGDVDYGRVSATGQRSGIRATITKEMVEQAKQRNLGSTADRDIRPPGLDSLPNGSQARLHLLGRQLGGSGKVEENLVAGYQTRANNPNMRRCENLIAAAASEQDVLYEVTPVYASPTQEIPDAIKMYAVGADGEVIVNTTVLNTPTGDVDCLADETRGEE